MKFKSRLLEGMLLQRYKRFFADVEYEGEKITIHVPNTGSLKGVISKDSAQKCWFSLHGDESKKLKGTLEAVQTPEGVWVGINTSHPNKLVQESILHAREQGRAHLPHWLPYGFYKSECKISKETRLDGVFCTQEADMQSEDISKHFIEIKNTTLLDKKDGKNVAMFPDAVTERGQKHLKELMGLIEKGHKAELIFTIQRSDVELFTTADDIDPEYGRLFREALKKGLIVTPLIVEITRDEVRLTDRVLPVIGS